ncbi:MAG: ATP-binding protein [Proteobacteria bacterium]|nr:ATP-binding protein [Pseudomonadota bacterium]
MRAIEFMERQILLELEKWSYNSQRLPLLLRGARQVGKTFTIEQLAALRFRQFVNINFELEPHYCECFQSLKPVDIINTMQAISRLQITPGNTLLFLDEIQNCPRAIMALRYFKEQMPDLHVIGAGSLLEFALHDENFSMPVGRVQFIYLKPLSFQEFLLALGFSDLIAAIKETTLNMPLPEPLHQKLLMLTRDYMITGGMPAVVQAYLQNRDFLQTQRLQTAILATYRNDFGKYARFAQHKYLQKVFNTAPGMIGQQIKYTHLDSEMRSRDLKQAVENLRMAGIIHPIHATTANGLALSALMNEKKFKWLFLDVGLLVRSTSITANELLKENIHLINRGAIAEQLAGQELLAYQDFYQEPQLYFWHREERGSLAEVDFVTNLNSQIVPIEVKSGNKGQRKSLQIFLAEKKIPLAVRISQLPLHLHQNILSIPFYLISELKRLIGRI